MVEKLANSAYKPSRDLWRTQFFTALHGIQTRSSDENYVRLSVRPYVTRVNRDKTEEKSVTKEHLA